MVHRSKGRLAISPISSFPVDPIFQVNIEHQMLGREGNVVEGKEANDSGDSGSDSISREDRQFEDKKAADLA